MRDLTEPLGLDSRSNLRMNIKMLPTPREPYPWPMRIIVTTYQHKKCICLHLGSLKLIKLIYTFHHETQKNHKENANTTGKKKRKKNLAP